MKATHSLRSIGAIAATMAFLCVGGCTRITTDPGYETVIIDNPYIFGHGGVREEIQKPGSSWYPMSTSGVAIRLTPIKYDEPLDHLATNDGNFINYASYIVLQWKDPGLMVSKFGYDKWYESNLKEQYRTIVRDVTKQFPMNKIMTDPETLASIEKEISKQFRAHIAQTGLHVDLLNVNMGKALPNASVITEMDNTAVNQQKVKSENQRKLSEDARLQAEKSRAHADNAYREEMKLDANQFVQLEAIKRYSEACKESKNCVIVQGGSSVMVGAGQSK